MVNDKILEFYKEFQDEVLTYVKENSPISTNTAFKTLFLSYLTEAGETLVSDCMLVDFKKDSENMKLDGYAFSEYFRSLTLLVSKYQAKPIPEKIKKTEIYKLLKKVLKFYKTCGTNDFEALEESSDGYQAYKFIKGHKADIETVNIILLTNDETIRYIPDDVHYGKITVRFDVWDIERLYQSVLGGTAVERQLVIKLKKKYGGSLPLIKVKGDNEIYDCYIGVISGELLARIYETEGQDLIQKNVRSFLQAIGKVNKGIKVSLANEPQMFMAYNNGISTIAESIAVDEGRSNGDIVNITEITGWQIVNGGQTTASIYNAYKAKLPLEQVNVQIKLSVIKQKDRAEEIIHNISKYANSQNKINMSDFNANDAYHVKMERLSRATPIPVAKGKSTDYWFYERARGQYLVELNRQPTAAAKKEFKSRCPKNRCISKTVAAKCVMTYRGYPDIVSKGLETSFIYFSDMVSKGEVPEPSEQSYIEMIAKVILFNSCDEIIKNLKFGGFKAQQDYYTVALFGKYYSDLFDPLEIWNRQSINAETAKTIEELAYFVWNHFQNPTVPGVNIGQWCKKEECWELLQARYACSVSVLAPVFHTVIDVFPAGISQKHRPVIGFAGFHGIEALCLCFSIFEQRGGDLRGERFPAFLKKSVILPHDKLAGPVSAVVVFPALVDGLAVAGTRSDCRTLSLKQFLLILTDAGMGFHQLPRHSLNTGHKLVRFSLLLGNLGQTAFPFSGKLGRSQSLRQYHGQIDAVLGRNERLSLSLHKAHLYQLFPNSGAGGRCA